MMSPPRRRNTTDNISSPPVASTRSPEDSGPIFTDVQEIDGCSSIESALGVPSTILFRRVGGERKVPEGDNHAKDNTGKTSSNNERRRRSRPLLSRQEAEQFLRLTLLAQEIDVLVDLSEAVLSRREFARRFRRDVLMQQNAGAYASNENAWKNPWLAPLGPILDVLEQRQSRNSDEPNRYQSHNFASNPRRNNPESILHHVNNELTRLYHELQACGVYELERSAEQNRSLVASLTDILGYNNDDLDGDGQGDDNNDSGRTSAVRQLAREKQSLSKLQDLLAKRVRSLLVVLCHSRTTTTIDGDKMDVDADNDDNVRNQILFDEQTSSTSNDTNTDNVGIDMSPSPTKKASHEEDKDDENKVGDDDKSNILSLEEILIPLEVVCEKLFGSPDPNNLSATVERTHGGTVSENFDNKAQDEMRTSCSVPTRKQKATTNETPPSRADEIGTTMTMTGNKFASDRTVEDLDPKTPITMEASQRTAGAAATIMALSGKDELSLTANQKETIQPGPENNSFDLETMITVEASQRTVGAAATMMTLGNKAGHDSGSERNAFQESQNNHNRDETVNGTHPHDQQYCVNDDDSFIDDPPSDGEEEKKATGFEDNAKSDVGIFDVVDVLTPQS
jgi:hypothetical protein